ncbi:MAG TPA: galactokinase family protein [Terriglobales bacterium]|nr:galactokinase family protein [Terriglobales bacterium]
MPHSLEAQLREAGMGADAASAHAAMLMRVGRAWRQWTASEPTAWFVPGRIELLGKHTDYAGGRSLLCALERGFCVLAAPRRDGQVRLLDVDWRSQVEFAAGGPPPPHAPWAIYPAAVARRLAHDFPNSTVAQGADLAFASSLPRAAGMSSSSALVVGSFLALGDDAIAAQLGGRLQWAEYLAAVEAGHDGVGTHGGSEDHTAILCCQPGQWSQFRFCPTRHEATLPAPAGKVLVIAVSGVVAAKNGPAQAAYNQVARRAAAILECWNAAAGAAHPHLAAVLAQHAPEEVRHVLGRHPHPEFSPASLLARFDQFWRESEVLVPAAAAAVARGDGQALGECVAESQAGAVVGLENQTPETEALVKSARALGAVAASAFGAGFGGAVWALVARGEHRSFRRSWRSDYARQFADQARNSLFFVSAAGPPALELAWDASAAQEGTDGRHQLEPA